MKNFIAACALAIGLMALMSTLAWLSGHYQWWIVVEGTCRQQESREIVVFMLHFFSIVFGGFGLFYLI